MPTHELVTMDSWMNSIDCVSLLKPQTVFDSLSFTLEVFSAWHLMVGWSEVDELPGTVAQGVDFQLTTLGVAPCPVPTPSAWNLQALGFQVSLEQMFLPLFDACQ